MYLSQFQLKIHHIPGLKNELCDFLSRSQFEELTNTEIDKLASEAFARMDRQLDLTMQSLLSMTRELQFKKEDYQNGEFQNIWVQLGEYVTTIVDAKMFYKTEEELFCERKLVVPDNKLQDTILWCHRSNGHPGVDRSVWFFLQHFYTNLSRQETMIMAKMVLANCPICLKSKPNSAPDRGLLSALPIPQLSNDMVFVDFIHMDAINNYDYVLTIVDGLTRFVKFVPCKSTISGENTLKIILQEWIQNFGKPKEILSDNDVRFVQEKGFYQSSFRALGVEVHFGIPRHPQSNGLCERMNRSFIQNLRAMSMEMKTLEWPKLCPLVSWVINSQVSTQTGYSPSELFLGRPAWQFHVLPEPGANPLVQNWLESQMLMQEQAIKRLEHLRNQSLMRRNKRRVQSSYKVNDFVPIHKIRWPQRRLLKIESPWLGPYKIVEVHFNSLKVLVSPNLGGLIKVSLSQVKRWSDLWEFSQDQIPDDDEDEQPEIEQEEFQDEIMTREEQEEQGFYDVQEVLKHKYMQGWKFLTHWEGFPISAATWEPSKSFKLTHGRVNSKFREYCEKNNLLEILRRTLQ